MNDVRKSVAFYRNFLEFKLEHYVIGSAKEVSTLSSSDPSRTPPICSQEPSVSVWKRASIPRSQEVRGTCFM